VSFFEAAITVATIYTEVYYDRKIPAESPQICAQHSATRSQSNETNLTSPSCGTPAFTSVGHSILAGNMLTEKFLLLSISHNLGVSREFISFFNPRPTKEGNTYSSLLTAVTIGSTSFSNVTPCGLVP